VSSPTLRVRPPTRQPFAERGLGEGRVIVSAAALVDLDLPGAVLRGREAGEHAFRRDRSVATAVADPPMLTARTFGPRHDGNLHM
jgi:hypothetical protein